MTHAPKAWVRLQPSENYCEISAEFPLQLKDHSEVPALIPKLFFTVQ